MYVELYFEYQVRAIQFSLPPNLKAKYIYFYQSHSKNTLLYFDTKT